MTLIVCILLAVAFTAIVLEGFIAVTRFERQLAAGTNDAGYEVE